jgi:hypothetical protein
MMKNKVVETKIDKLIPDDLNANKGTEYGQHLIEKSLRELGAGRSILLDKNNRIIAGNKTIENASAIGMENIIIVETTGDKIVAVKRTDIDLDSKQGRELAIADNSTSKVNLAWDSENIQKIQSEWEVDTEEWGVQETFTPIAEDETDPFVDKGIDVANKFGVIVMCESEIEQEAAFNKLEKMGYKCKVVVV